jgi:predicted Rossmann fold flavoprotein
LKITIIGGGAAGFFSAIAAKENYPDADVVIYEKSQKLLAKVRISGGGRCNVTNGCDSIDELCKAYPRGGRKLKKAFYVFNNRHAIEWFESRGVPMFVEEDGRVFPASRRSQSIIDCFLKETGGLGIEIRTGKGVRYIKPEKNKLRIDFEKDEDRPIFDKVIIATGGSPERKGLEWLEKLSHKIVDPVPSLFSFDLPGESITGLTGVSVENALVSMKGTKLSSSGPLLITHHGMSGPAILKLSSFGARIMNECDYEFKIRINWANERDNDVVADQLRQITRGNPGKSLSNFRPYSLPSRLWLFLLEKADIPGHKDWGELGNKGLFRLVNLLANDEYSVNGRSPFKEEFVTCGGVSLESVDMATMQSKSCKNMYFAGEILDIDGITGGFNFQAAWTTGFIAGKLG